MQNYIIVALPNHKLQEDLEISTEYSPFTYYVAEIDSEGVARPYWSYGYETPEEAKRALWAA